MVWPRPYSLSGWIVDSRISSVSWGHGLPWECRSQGDSRDCDRAASKCRILGSRLLHQLLILRNSAKSLPLVCFGNWSTTVRHFRPARSMGEVVGGLYIISFQVFNFKPFQCHVWFAILRASRCRIRIGPLSEFLWPGFPDFAAGHFSWVHRPQARIRKFDAGGSGFLHPRCIE